MCDEGADRLRALRPAVGAELRLLGCEAPVPWREEGGACVFALPAGVEDLPRPLVLAFDLGEA